MKFNKAFKMNEEKLSKGTWVPFEGMEFLIASAFGRAWQDAVVDHARRFSGPAARTPQAERAYAELIAEHLLLDWNGVDDDEGKELPYSRKAAASLLLAHTMFSRFVQGVATTEGFYRAEAQQEHLKNSSPASAGTSTATAAGNTPGGSES